MLTDKTQLFLLKTAKDFGFCGMKRRISPPAGFLAGFGLLWFPAIICREMTLPVGGIRVSGSFG